MRDSDHSAPSSSEVKNMWSDTSTSQLCLLGVIVKQRDNFAFTFTFYVKFTRVRKGTAEINTWI